MPSIRTAGVDSTAIHFTDHRGVPQSITWASIPVPGTDLAATENYINNTWLPAHADLSAYQMVVHIFSMNPVVALAYITEIGMPIPPNWWLQT